MLKKPKNIAILVASLLFLFVLFQNSDSIRLELFFWDMFVPLFILIIFAILLGWCGGWFAHFAYVKGKQHAGASSGNIRSKTDPKETPHGKSPPTAGVD